MIRKTESQPIPPYHSQELPVPLESDCVNNEAGATRDQFILRSVTGTAPSAGSSAPKGIAIDKAMQIVQGEKDIKDIKDLRVSWEQSVGYGVATSPIEMADGSLLVGSHGGVIFRVKNDSAELFHNTGNGMSDIHLAPDGTIYVADGHGKLMALKEGKTLWEFDTGNRINPAPALGPDGTVYAGNNDGKLFAVKDGKKLWEKKLGAYIAAPPVVGPDGTLYVIDDKGTLHAYKGKKQAWAMEVGQFVSTKPCVTDDGTVYVGSDNNGLMAIKNGKLKWKFNTGRNSCSSPVLGPDGTLYFGSSDRKLYALKEGKKVWEYETDDQIATKPPTLGPDGTLYVLNNLYGQYQRDQAQPHYGTVIAVKEGKKLWDFTADQFIQNSPAVGADGTVYAASEFGRFFAFHGTPDGIYPEEETKEAGSLVEQVDDMVVIDGVKLPVMQHINVENLMKEDRK